MVTLKKENFRFANVLSFFAWFTMIFSGGLLPWYILCTKYYGLQNNIWALILPYGMNVFYMFVLKSNFKAVPEELVEAARIDGCSRMNLFRYITFPMLAPATTINITLAFTQSLKVFDIVYAMTNGGPLNATETVGTYVIRNMGLNLHGYASAMTVLLMFVIILTGTVLIGRLKKREAEIY